MSTVNLYKAYLGKIRKFGMQVDSSRFRASFVDALNRAYAELNDLVFGSQVLAYIESFDDIIDARLSFSALNTYTSDSVMQGREFWKIEYWFERKSDTNGFTDDFDDTNGVSVSILDGVVSLVGGSVSASATLPDLDTFKLSIESTSAGNALYVNDEPLDVTYALGDEQTSQAIGTITAHVTNGVSGLQLLRVRFLSSSSLIYDYQFNEGTGASSTDEVAGYTVVISVPAWSSVYVEPSSSLDSQYLAVLDLAMDYHLQDGGEWAIEPEQERERKWYGRGIKNARSIYQNNSTYTGPLGDR